MTSSFKVFSKLSFAMLALVSAAFFVVPAKQEVQAQGSGNRVGICFNPTSGATSARPSSGTCPTGFGDFSASRVGVCVSDPYPGNTSYSISNPTLKTDGTPLLNAAKTKCLSADNPPVEIGAYRTIASITGTTPGGGNGNGNNNGNGNGNGNNNGNGNGNTKPPVQTQGDCETGFHKLGPLCVPNSPVGSGDSILGEQTAGGLAARIVRILLYFAGIVAVIMAIIGGYYVMTAGGNEAQATSGRKTLTNAIIGLVIVILSYVIIQAVLSFVT